MGAEKKILVLILLFLIARLILLFNNAVYWDAAVYTGMGKYIFSFGKEGLWEPSRPLIWPIFLGLFWKLGLNPIFFGRVLTLFFSIGCVYLTYLIGKDIFNKKTALTAAFLLAFSPIFFYNNTTLLTEIPSLFFALLGIYFFIKKRDVLAGFFIAIAFLTRFYQAFILLVLIFFLFCKKNNATYKRTIILFSAFIITIIPYFLLNQILYNNALYPLSLQADMIKNTGWPWFEPFSFYFVNLFKENFLVIFSILGIIIVLKEKNPKKWLLAVLFLIFLFLFSFVRHKEMRFIIIALPYLYLLVASGLLHFLNIIKKKRFIIILLFFIFTCWIVQTAPHLYVKLPEQELTEFQTYLNKDTNGKIWISDPRQILFSDKKADFLIYYPIFNFEKAKEIVEGTEQPINILLNTCDIQCAPNDEACKIGSQKFFGLVKTFKIEYYNKTNSCEEIIAIFNP